MMINALGVQGVAAKLDDSAGVPYSNWSEPLIKKIFAYSDNQTRGSLIQVSHRFNRCVVSNYSRILKAEYSSFALHFINKCNEADPDPERSKSRLQLLESCEANVKEIIVTHETQNFQKSFQSLDVELASKIASLIKPELLANGSVQDKTIRSLIQDIYEIPTRYDRAELNQMIVSHIGLRSLSSEIYLQSLMPAQFNPRESSGIEIVMNVLKWIYG